MFRGMVRQWVESELTPYAEEWEQAEIFPKEIFRKAFAPRYLYNASDRQLKKFR